LLGLGLVWLSPQPSQPPAQAASFLHPIWPSPLASRNLAREPRARQSKHEAATDSKSVAAQLIPSPASSPSANRLELASGAPLIFWPKQGPSRALPPILFHRTNPPSPRLVQGKEGRRKSGGKKKETASKPSLSPIELLVPVRPPPARPLPTTSPLPSAPAPDDLGLSPARADFSPNRAPLPARGHAEHLRYGQRAVSLRESPRVPTETARGLQRSVGRGLVRSDWWLRLGFGFLLLLL